MPARPENSIVAEGRAQVRHPGDGSNHHACKQLHGARVLVVESAGGRREYFEYSQGPMALAQWSSQNGTDTESAAACQVHLRVIFSIIAKDDFAAAQAFGRNTRVGLQPDADIGRGSSSARAADNFTAAA